MDNLLKRYYQGDTSLDEEKQLRAMFKQGHFQDEKLLSIDNREIQIPPQTEAKIRQALQKRCHRKVRIHNLYTLAGSIAAIAILIFTIRGFLPSADTSQIILTDNMKKERFEDALRIIGNVLDEKHPPIQQVLYEDNKLIIAIE